VTAPHPNGAEPVEDPPVEDDLGGEGLATIAEACRYLRVSPSTVYAWLAAGRVGSVRLGRARRLRWRDLRRIAREGLP
jgi:excisionase family DNA binding protein